MAVGSNGLRRASVNVNICQFTNGVKMSAEVNNVSRVLKLAQKFNCFYLSGKSDAISHLLIRFATDFHWWSAAKPFSSLVYGIIDLCTPKRFPLGKKNSQIVSGLKSLECKPFVVEGCQVGLVRPDVMKQLLRYPEVKINRKNSKGLRLICWCSRCSRCRRAVSSSIPRSETTRSAAIRSTKCLSSWGLRTRSSPSKAGGMRYIVFQLMLNY